MRAVCHEMRAQLYQAVSRRYVAGPRNIGLRFPLQVPDRSRQPPVAVAILDVHAAAYRAIIKFDGSDQSFRIHRAYPGQRRRHSNPHHTRRTYDRNFVLYQQIRDNRKTRDGRKRNTETCADAPSQTQ